MDHPEDQLRPSESDVYRLETSVDWPPGHAAAYLIDGESPILIDAGTPGERGRSELVAGLDDLGVEITEIEHLLLTHPHTDHIGQAKTIIEAADPRVYALDGVRSRLSRSVEDLAASVRETAREAGLDESASVVKEAQSSLRRNRQLLPPEEIDVALTHGQRLSVAGRECEVIHTPGHQADHASFLFPETGRLFGGDALIAPFRAAALDVGLDQGVTASFSQYYTAYDRLADRAIDRVYPGHGPVFTDSEAVLDRSRRDLDETVETTYEAVTANAPATAVEATHSPEDAPDRLTPALLETLGAIGRLETAGRIESIDDSSPKQYRPTD